MSQQIYDALDAKIAALNEGKVLDIAEDIANMARSDGNYLLASYLDQFLDKSAKGNGVAAFYSGDGENGIKNIENARNLKESGYDVYLLEDTEVGRALDGRNQLAFDDLYSNTYSRFDDLGSAMMADQAKGPVIACVSGDVR